VSPSAAVAAGWPEHKRADGSASGHTISPHFALLRGYDPIKKKGKIPKTIQISIANLIYGNSTFFLVFRLTHRIVVNLPYATLKNIEQPFNSLSPKRKNEFEMKVIWYGHF
jgi:hypothetical protein